MTTTTITVLVITFFSLTMADRLSREGPGNIMRQTKDEPATSFCRKFKGSFRCAVKPLPRTDKGLWCTYRKCSQSYVPAELCPVDLDLQATDACMVEQITGDMYRCDGNDFGQTYVPIGCKKGTHGCVKVSSCSCALLKGYTSRVYKQIAPFKPNCKTGGVKPPTSPPRTEKPPTPSPSSEKESAPSPSPHKSRTPSPSPEKSRTPSTTQEKIPPPPRPSPKLVPDHVNVDCAKCGQVLECYVNSGFTMVDSAVCNVIQDASLFCPARGGKATTCGQQCSGKEGVKCFTGESWDTCPAVLGSTGGAAKCKGGANGGPAALSNFASYTVSVGGTPSVSCFLSKCDSGGTCTCAAPQTFALS